MKFEKIDSGVCVSRANVGEVRDFRPLQGFRVRSRLVRGRVVTTYEKK